ncbi:hypothetical protein MRX96_032365 [Rhipicephalus microplus]
MERKKPIGYGKFVLSLTSSETLASNCRTHQTSVLMSQLFPSPPIDSKEKEAELDSSVAALQALNSSINTVVDGISRPDSDATSRPDGASNSSTSGPSSRPCSGPSFGDSTIPTPSLASGTKSGGILEPTKFYFATPGYDERRSRHRRFSLVILLSIVVKCGILGCATGVLVTVVRTRRVNSGLLDNENDTGEAAEEIGEGTKTMLPEGGIKDCRACRVGPGPATPGPVVNACWRHPRAPFLKTNSLPSSSEPTSLDIKPQGRGHLTTRRSSPASGRRRPARAVKVYKPFLAFHSRSGHQCPLVTPTDPGRCDHFAAVVVVAWIFLPRRPSTRSCHLEKSLPRHAYTPPPTCRVHRVTRPGFRSSPAASRSPFGAEHSGAAPGPVASSWHPGVYWRFCGSVGSFSHLTARRSTVHYDGVPAGAPDAALPLCRLRGLPSLHISIASTVHVAVPHGANARDSANEASLPVRRL